MDAEWQLRHWRDRIHRRRGRCWRPSQSRQREGYSAYGKRDSADARMRDVCGSTRVRHRVWPLVLSTMQPVRLMANMRTLHTTVVTP